MKACMLDLFFLQWNYCRQLQSWGLGFGAGWSILGASRWLNPFCFFWDWRKKMSTLNGSRREIIAGSPSSPPPHLVMVPTPGLGHENPFLQAARRIADEGIIVTYVSTDRHISQVLNRPEFVHLRRSSSSSQILRFVNLRDGMGHVAEREFYLIMRTQEVVTKLTQLLEEVVIDLCSPETEKTRSVASAPPPCCILHDMFSTWAQDVADNLQLAKHMLYVSPACCLAIVFQVSLPSFWSFFCVLEMHCRKSKRIRGTQKRFVVNFKP